MSKISRIEVDFQEPVDLPEGFERALDGLLTMICERYRVQNPTRVMWVAGGGAKPLWNEPEEPGFDDSVLYMEVAEKERPPRKGSPPVTETGEGS